jgi:hypothetical protein
MGAPGHNVSRMRVWEISLIAIYAAGVVIIGATNLSDRWPLIVVWVWLIGGPIAAGYAIGRTAGVLLALLWPAVGWIGESDDAPAWQTAVLQMFPLTAVLLLGGVLLRKQAGD